MEKKDNVRPEWDAWLNGVRAAVAEFQELTARRANLLAFQIHDDLTPVLLQVIEEPPWREEEFEKRLDAMTGVDWDDEEALERALETVFDEVMDEEETYFESKGRLGEYFRATVWEFAAEDLSLRLGLSAKHCLLMLLCLEDIPNYGEFALYEENAKQGVKRRFQCRGFTADGASCKKKRVKGTAFCHLHQSQASTTQSIGDLVSELRKKLKGEDSDDEGV
jgi:hypothetical protein